MGRVLCCLIMFLATLPRMVHAAGNPVVDALAQGAVVQYSGKEAVSNGYDFELTIATGDCECRSEPSKKRPSRNVAPTVSK